MSLEIAIPISVFGIEPDEVIRTYKLGYIARTAAVFRVKEVHIYIDELQYLWLSRRIIKLLLYLIVAPYLRRLVFRRSDTDLAYAGALPPLQLVTHGLGGPRRGEVRQALLVAKKARSFLVEAGLGRRVEVKPIKGSLDDYIFLDIEGKKIIHVYVDDPSKPMITPMSLSLLSKLGAYLGYKPSIHQSLASLLRKKQSKCRIVVATRYGRGLSHPETTLNLRTMLSEGNCILIVFGGPRKGVLEIAASEGIDIARLMDIAVSIAPWQGLIVMRTEEAITALLAIVDFIRHSFSLSVE